MNENNLQLAIKAVEWLGVPYQHRAFTRNGCDCTGLLIGIAKERGYLRDYRPRKYPPDWNIHKIDNHIIEELSRFGTEIPKNQVSPGDIVVFHFGKNISHCGIFIDSKKMTFIHCYRTLKKVSIGFLRDSKWSRKWVKTFRVDFNR